MLDFNALSKIAFGWPQVILFYIIFIMMFFLIRKSRNYLILKKTSFLDLIYILSIIAIGGAYLTIFVHGEKFIPGKLFISTGNGNKSIITWSSVFFMFLIAIFASPNIKG
ncbi:TPA: hypothetical protein ACYSAQ_003059 [Morganella morganii]